MTLAPTPATWSFLRPETGALRPPIPKGRSGFSPNGSCARPRCSATPTALLRCAILVRLLSPFDQVRNDDRVDGQEDDPSDAVPEQDADRDPGEHPEPEQPLVHQPEPFVCHVRQTGFHAPPAAQERHAPTFKTLMSSPLARATALRASNRRYATSVARHSGTLGQPRISILVPPSA